LSGANSPKKTNTGSTKISSNKNNEKEEEKRLTSPTSISMLNSFIVKNADVSFDHYFN
jgi:hypothetical protein